MNSSRARFYDFIHLVDAIHWRDSTSAAKVEAAIERNLKTRHVSAVESSPCRTVWLRNALFILPLFSRRLIGAVPACDYYGSRWTGQKWGVGNGLEGEIRSAGLADNTSFTTWQPCLHGTTKSKVNKTRRLNQIRQAVLYVWRLTCVRGGEVQKATGWWRVLL